MGLAPASAWPIVGLMSAARHHCSLMMGEEPGEGHFQVVVSACAIIIGTLRGFRCRSV